MPNYTVKFIRKEEIAEGTVAFHFEKPDGFVFKAGQYNDYTLINPPETDDEGNVRSFTIASAPYESDLVIATRMRDSAFKRVLSAMKPGDEIAFDGPSGEFVLHDDSSITAVFLTGGIGSTPIRSILLNALNAKLPYTIFVFYSNHRPEDAAYLGDLTKDRVENPNYTFIPTMTDPDKSNIEWVGETGPITSTMLEKYIDDLSKPIFYIDGPPEMVKAMKNLLIDEGVNEGRVKTEDFEGY